MGAWVDITEAANWTPRYYPVDDDGCNSTWAAASASAHKYAFSAGKWVGPVLDVSSGGVTNPAALPTLEYVGATDVSSATALRVTAVVQDDFTLTVDGSNEALMVAADPTDPSPLYEYDEDPLPAPFVRGDTLDAGLYSAATELVIEGACTPASLAAITAVVIGRDSDNCGVFMNYTDKALSITKIEVFIDAVPSFWTNFVNCAELP